MSNRFHSKYHRRNHHTYTNATNPDAGHDPIASPENPFLGDFVLQGALSASAPLSAVAGSFYSGNTALLITSPQTALLARGAVKIEGDLTVTGNINGTTNSSPVTSESITYTFNGGLEKSISNVVTVKVDNSTIRLNNDGQLAADFSTINLSPSGTPVSYAFGDGISSSMSSNNGATLYTVSAAPDNSTIKISSGKLSLVKDYSFSNGVTFNSITNTVSAAVDNDSIKVAGGLLKLGYNISVAGTAITKDTSNNLKVNIDESTIKVDSSNKLYADFTAGPGLIKDTSNVFSVKYDPSSFSITNGFLTSTGNLKTSISTSQTVAGTVNFTKTIRANDGIRFIDGSVMRTAVSNKPYIAFLGEAGCTYYDGAVVTSDNRIVVWGNNDHYHSAGSVIWPPASLSFKGNYASTNNVLINKMRYNRYNTFALLSDGTLWGSGYAPSTHLGLKTVVSTSNRERVLQQVNISEYISTFDSCCDDNSGYGNFAALTIDGGLYVWGYNNGGIGVGNTGLTNVPVHPTAPVSTTSGITDARVYIYNGYSKADFIKDGTLYSCCNYNIYGNTGIGNTTTPNTFSTCLQAAGTPVTNVAKLANSSTWSFQSSYIIKTDGSVWSCGLNNSGQLGIGSIDTVAHPYFTKISALSNLNIVDVVVSGSSTWASVYALTDNGQVYSWGYNGYGQLGHGHTNAVSTPTKISLIAGGSSDNVIITKIFKGNHYGEGSVVALKDVYGNLYAAGLGAPTLSNASNYTGVVSRFDLVPISNVDDVQMMTDTRHVEGMIIKDTSNRVFVHSRVASSYFGGPRNDALYMPTEFTNYLV